MVSPPLSTNGDSTLKLTVSAVCAACVGDGDGLGDALGDGDAVGVGVAVTLGVGVGVALGDGDAVGVGVAVTLGEGDAVADALDVGVADALGDGHTGLGVGDGVAVGDGDALAVGDGDAVGVGVGDAVGVGVGVADALGDGDAVGVGVGVAVALGAGDEESFGAADTLLGVGVGVGVGVADALGVGVGDADGVGVGVADALGVGVADADALGVGVGDEDEAGAVIVTGKPQASLIAIWAWVENVNVIAVMLLTKPPGAVQSEAVTVIVGEDVSAVPGVAGFEAASVVNVAWVQLIVTLTPNGSKISVRSVPDSSPADSTSEVATLVPPALPVVSTSIVGPPHAVAVTATADKAAAAKNWGFRTEATAANRGFRMGGIPFLR
jgi:hypothetical protein